MISPSKARKPNPPPPNSHIFSYSTVLGTDPMHVAVLEESELLLLCIFMWVLASFKVKSKDENGLVFVRKANPVSIFMVENGRLDIGLDERGNWLFRF